MMDDVMRAAFADELSKIASINWAPAKAIMKEGLVGASDQHIALRGLGLLGAAAQAKQGIQSGMQKQDPSGMGRSRPERLAGSGGEMLGGILGGGMASRAVASQTARRLAVGGRAVGGMAGFAGMLAGGIGGSLAGHALAAAPFAMKRRLMGRKSPQQMLPPSDEGWRNTAPGGLNTTPDATVGQAQAM